MCVIMDKMCVSLVSGHRVSADSEAEAGELTVLLRPLQAGAGSEAAEGGAAEQPAERAGAAQPRLQPDQQ